jgi:hypothetical protein
VPADQIRQGEDGRWCPLSEIREVSEMCRSERGDVVPDAENEIEKRRSPKGHEAKRKIRPRQRVAEKSLSHDELVEIETLAEPFGNENSSVSDVLLSSGKAETQTGIFDDDFEPNLSVPLEQLHSTSQPGQGLDENSLEPESGDPSSVSGGRMSVIRRKFSEMILKRVRGDNMSIKVSCTCGKKISAKDEFAGRQVKCPACKKSLRIPKPKVEEVSYDDEWDLDDYGEEAANEAELGSPEFDRLIAMSEQVESLGKGTVEGARPGLRYVAVG